MRTQSNHRSCGPLSACTTDRRSSADVRYRFTPSWLSDVVDVDKFVDVSILEISKVIVPLTLSFLLLFTL